LITTKNRAEWPLAYELQISAVPSNGN
jgi:hypothetical protein